MSTASNDSEGPTELILLPDPDELEPGDEPEEIAEVPTQPIALFDLPPSKP